VTRSKRLLLPDVQQENYSLEMRHDDLETLQTDHRQVREPLETILSVPSTTKARHSASFHSREKIAPSNPGIKHLARDQVSVGHTIIPRSAGWLLAHARPGLIRPAANRYGFTLNTPPMTATKKITTLTKSNLFVQRNAAKLSARIEFGGSHSSDYKCPDAQGYKFRVTTDQPSSGILGTCQTNTSDDVQFWLNG
jgi:hypothetical protein